MSLISALIDCCQRDESHLYFPDGLLNLNSFINVKVDQQEFIRVYMKNYEIELDKYIKKNNGKFRPPASYHASYCFENINYTVIKQAFGNDWIQLEAIVSKLRLKETNCYYDSLDICQTNIEFPQETLDQMTGTLARKYRNEKIREIIPAFSYITFFNALEFLPIQTVKLILFHLTLNEFRTSKYPLFCSISTCLLGEDNMYYGEVILHAKTIVDLAGDNFTKAVFDELGINFQMNYCKLIY